MCSLEWLRATSESQVAPDTLVVAHGDLRARHSRAVRFTSPQPRDWPRVGDLRTDNMIFDASGSDVVALLDWELAALGHPLGDLAYRLCMRHATPPSNEN